MLELRPVKPYNLWFSNARRKYLFNALANANGNQCAAAALMGVHRNTVKRMLSEENITRDEIRSIVRPKKAETVTHAR